MVGSTKNLGQVAGVYIGNNPPSNVVLIWYDNTPSQMCHKVYDPGLKQWVVLDQNVISLITYSELVNLAKNVGLSVGQWFQIKDKGNALALAITTTKVQYDDRLGNILIDDLGTNIQYHVTSSNFSIDDVTGVFDEVNKKLVFQFNEVVPDFTADDYILGKIKRNNVWSLAKYKLSSFLSKVTGNSISWNGGFFFSFSEALKGQLDKKGGVVSKDTYDTDMQTINQNIQNVGKANQEIISNSNKAITEATSDEAIYNKQSPALETGGEPTDAAKGDKLVTILSKFQRYITKFKYATGIRVSTDFTDAVQPEYVNNNDTVDSALRKMQYWVKKQKTEALPTDILRFDVTAHFTMNGCAFGGVMVQGYENFLFTQTSSEYPYNPYNLGTSYNSEFPKILSFVPVIPVVFNRLYEQYSNANTLVHYTEGDVTLQLIFQIQKDVYDSLHADYHALRCNMEVNVYGSLIEEQEVTVELNYINIFNISLKQSTLMKGDKQHIIFKALITAF